MTARRLRAGTLALSTLAALGLAGAAYGQDAGADDLIAKLTASSSDLRIGIDTVWVLVTAMLVFWMNAGFALVESGLCRAEELRPTSSPRTSSCSRSRRSRSG